jgi:hypothetical protein
VRGLSGLPLARLNGRNRIALVDSSLPSWHIY